MSIFEKKVSAESPRRAFCQAVQALICLRLEVLETIATQPVSTFLLKDRVLLRSAIKLSLKPTGHS